MPLALAFYYYCLENLNIFVKYLYHKHVVIQHAVIIYFDSFKSLLEPIAVAKEGNRPGPNAPAPGQQVLHYL